MKILITSIVDLKKSQQQTFRKSLIKNAAHASLNWNNPFGDGKAGERIVEILERECE